ncbi:hypothetical protein RM780_24645 [Streptomyces sp. DSM 44917]|uniref:Uncharacterized protein n=1 Tax=Streptomyces boetiae TaxID=3075541 RepID=A0ABU2LEX8_9ACTN|nr:hypothetical protein [Streptomyces sp. DSM 44917]MDT0310119.1 hypothetical protein [Streptomyces sp. DSM 44917]
MRSYGGVLLGNLVFAAVCCFPGPLALVVGWVAWSEGEDWAWTVLVGGLLMSAVIPFVAVRSARSQFPRITRADQVREKDVPLAEDSFVLWAPRSPEGHPQARLVRADVLEASLVRYSPSGEGTFTTCSGQATPDEFTPLVRLRLRVHGEEEGEEGGRAAPC